MPNVLADIRVIDDDGQPIWVKQVDDGKIVTVTHVWNPITLSYETLTQPLINTDTLNVDSDVTDRAARDLGKVDIASLDQYTPVGGRLPVDGSGVTQPVSGTFYQATQPVSIATMPSTPVTGTFYPETQPVSAASLPLPAGAATAVSQTTLESLIETLQELIGRVAAIASWSNSGATGMRVVGVSMPSTAVTGPQTSAQFIATFPAGGVNYTARTAMENLAAQANVNNCTGV